MTNAKVGEIRNVPGSKSKELLDRIRTVEAQASIYPNFFGANHYTPVISDSYGIYLVDVDGNEYLDAIGGMACVVQGYKPKHIIDAVKRQLETLSFLPEMPSTSRLLLAEKLLSIAPGSLSHGKVHFEVSGSSAVELALQIAFTHIQKTGRKANKVLAFKGDYHGRLMSSTAVGGINTYRERFPTIMDVILAPFPYFYRSEMDGTSEEFEAAWYLELEKMFKEETDPDTGECNIGVVISEPFQSHVTRIPPKSFYKKLRQLCDDYDVVFIDDEVVGFLHTGNWFACENSNIEPDLIVIGKPLAGGLFPISAVIGNKEIMSSWEQSSDMHLTTYMGHPVGAAAALENLKSLEENKLIERGAELGKYFLARLRELKQKHPLIGNVDGWGLWLEAELVRDQITKEPAIEESIELQRELVKRGLIVDRSYGRSALYFIPSLIITIDELDIITKILDECLSIIEEKFNLNGL